MKVSFKRLLSLLLVMAIILCAIPGILATEANAATVTMTEYYSYIGKTWFKWYTQYAGYGSTVFDTGDYWTETIAYFTVNDGRTAQAGNARPYAVLRHPSLNDDLPPQILQAGATAFLHPRQTGKKDP